MEKKKKRINWTKVKDSSKRVVLGNPKEKIETGKTLNLFLFVVVLYILSILGTYVF